MLKCLCRILEMCGSAGLYVTTNGTVNIVEYRKIPTISPGTYIFQRPFLRGLSMKGNLRFKIDWASLIVGKKFTVFALFYFVFEGNFPEYKPPRGLYLEGRFNEGFFALRVWGAYIWRGLNVEGLIFEFYGIQ